VGPTDEKNDWFFKFSCLGIFQSHFLMGKDSNGHRAGKDSVLHINSESGQADGTWRIPNGYKLPVDNWFFYKESAIVPNPNGKECFLALRHDPSANRGARTIAAFLKPGQCSS